MKHLKLELQKAIDTYKNGDASVKSLLTNLYGEDVFITDIKQKVKCYPSACKVLGRCELTVGDFAKGRSNKQSEREFVRHKISTVIEAINNGWYPDWDNEDQYKYYNYFHNKRNGFSSGVIICRYFCGVGSDLCLENRDNAEYVSKICKEDYITFLF